MTDTPAARQRAFISAGEYRLTLRPLALIAMSVLLGPLAGPVAAEVAEDSIRIAILPVRVHSSASREYLRAGLIDMLASRLEQIDGIEVSRVDDPARATTSYQRAAETGRELGVDYVLFGSFTQFGQGASLDVQLAEVGTGEAPLRQIFVQSGTMGDVIPDLDDLVGKISRFAVNDFDTRLSAEPPIPGAPRRETLAGLRQRVKDLEAAMRRLDPSFDAEPAPAGATEPDAVSSPPASLVDDMAAR